MKCYVVEIESPIYEKEIFFQGYKNETIGYYVDIKTAQEEAEKACITRYPIDKRKIRITKIETID